MLSLRIAKSQCPYNWLWMINNIASPLLVCSTGLLFSVLYHMMWSATIP